MTRPGDSRVVPSIAAAVVGLFLPEMVAPVFPCEPSGCQVTQGVAFLLEVDQMRLVTGIAALLFISVSSSALANNTPQTLPFSQNWSNTGLITANDDWAAVPGIIGYLGDNPSTSVTGVNPTALVGDSTGVVDVIANVVSATNTSGGVAEIDGLANPVVALQGSGTADFPSLILNLDTSGFQTIQFTCNLRDVDGTADNSVQQVAVQYRVGTSGTWSNLTGGYVADASTGPSLATLVTPVSVTLPPAADNQLVVQIRVLTTNAVGSDEWIGIDDITANGTAIVTPVEATTWGKIKASVN